MRNVTFCHKKVKFVFFSIVVCLVCILFNVHMTYATVKPQISGGGSFSLALAADGTVWVWGGNNVGQLGDGTKENRTSPIQINNLSEIEKIAAGWEHCLVLKKDGTVWTWGNNNFGQLGDGTNTNRNVPKRVEGLDRVTDIDAGFFHSVVLKSDGTVWAWGNNEYDQLGNGTKEDSSLPVQIKHLNNIVDVASGNHHNLAIKSDGLLWAWGANGYGQLGNGTISKSSLAVAVHDLNGASRIECGNNFNVALKPDGSVWSWGYNEYGQLGIGTKKNSSAPVQINSLDGIVDISVKGYHGLALQSDGTVFSMGYNRFGQLGIGTRSNYRNDAFTIKRLSDITHIACGYYHCIAVKSDGSVWTWGNNEMGQLGDGTKLPKRRPVKIDFTLKQIEQTAEVTEVPPVSEEKQVQGKKEKVEKEKSTQDTQQSSPPEQTASSVQTWEPSTPQERAVKLVIDEFWVSVLQENWKGILDICSEKLLDQFYNKMVEGLSEVLKFSREEMEAYRRSITDPKEKKVINLAILHKEGKLGKLRQQCNRLAAEDILKQFEGKSVQHYQINDIKIDGNRAIVHGAFTFTIPGGTKEMKQKTTQLLVFRDGKWVFGM